MDTGAAFTEIEKEFFYNCRKNRLANGLILPKKVCEGLIQEDIRLERQGLIPKTLSYQENKILKKRILQKINWT